MINHAIIEIQTQISQSVPVIPVSLEVNKADKYQSPEDLDQCLRHSNISGIKQNVLECERHLHGDGLYNMGL